MTTTLTYAPYPGFTPSRLQINSTPAVDVAPVLAGGVWTFTFLTPADGSYVRTVTVSNGATTYDDAAPILFPLSDPTFLVSLADLIARLGTFPPSPTAAQTARANALLRRASARVRAYGKSTWNAATAPALAKEIALDLAERTWNNPRSDLTSQSTGSVSESYAAGSADLTAAEISDLRRLAGGRKSINSTLLQPDLRTAVLFPRHRRLDEDWPC